MMAVGVDLTAALMLVSHLLGTVLCAGAALWIWRFGDRKRPDRIAVIAALSLTAVWSVCVLAFPAGSVPVALAGTMASLGLLAVIFRLFSADGRDESLRPTRPLIAALVLVQLMQPSLALIRGEIGFMPEVAQLAFEVAALLQMLVAVGALVLLHNLYAGAAASSRQLIRWSALGLAGLFAYDLNLHTVAYLSAQPSTLLSGFRGIAAGLMAILCAFGANSGAAGLQFRPSRAVTFQSLSLLLIGSYLVLMVLVTRGIALMGGPIAPASQFVFFLLAAAAALIWLPSQRMRSWLRVMVAKHLFQHRYDYRQEWLRFTRTISSGSSVGESFHERAVKAIADITDSPAGLLLAPDEEAQLSLTARWNWPMIEVPALASNHVLSALLEQHSHILDLDQVRSGIDHHGELDHVPQWLRDAQDAWAMVPLIHFDRLVGVIVLARPRTMRRLDWEDFDLLRVVGHQLASYLAEQAGQQALMDASRFDEFNRRMAFVMHDIKNLASQLSLLTANAEKHAENPAFRADMLVTLRKSSEKLEALLARLGRYGAGVAHDVRDVDLAGIAQAAAARFAGVQQVLLVRSDPVAVLADPESLEQALVHLVQNGLDASQPDHPVHIAVTRDGLSGQIEVVDTGTGMSPEFVRSGLFKPFVSSKPGGFGIGAFEAREMIRAMGGRLRVESREGVGTRFTINLPVPESALARRQSALGSTAGHEGINHTPEEEAA